MYSFTQPNEVHQSASRSIETIFNNVNLDQAFNDGEFQTLVVNGRGLADYDVDTDDIAGADGMFSANSSVEPREITVRVKVKAVSNEDMRKYYRKLNRLLHTRRALPLSFTDEPEHYFNAYFISSNKPNEVSNEQVIELTFMCYDPFKYREQEVISEASSAQALSLDTDFPIRPDEIILRFDSQSDARSWVLNNTTNGQRIRFNLPSGSAASSIVNIKIKENFIGFNDLNRISQGLDLTYSDFRKFVVDDGDQLVINPAPVNFDLKYRGVSL